MSLSDYPTAWQGHLKLAPQIAEIVNPDVFVELGVHYGHSFFAFLNGCNEDCKCIAIDTWEGDDHAGKYGSDVYKIFSKEVTKYPDIDIDPWRMTFEDARELWNNEDEVWIDLLHIDGRHAYEDVRQDFEDWESLLTHNAVICFHDIQAYRKGFGVHMYWDQLKNRRNWYFTENNGSYGLGIMSRNEKLIERINEAIQDR